MWLGLRLRLDCEPDAAWRAIARPAVFRSVSAPLTTFSSLDGGFPASWGAGRPHAVAVRAFGVIPVGEQTIDVAFTWRPDGVRMMTDSGRPLSGPLSLIRSWRHRIAISPASDGGTLYRDRVEFTAPALAIPFVWLSLWVFWQWRALRLVRAARRWRA
ncbi:hypothetical protein [Diaminobutyricimonas sp. LJ205]|uniref:hypothetical protein n=1 Tax=Diaminobutyricimonas sp. LJ205 TaxID=2683590 RepID=UPI0012F482A6|nr:hypothetical protein [Diaminobutyricimonas sp. LJ205]